MAFSQKWNINSPTDNDDKRKSKQAPNETVQKMTDDKNESNKTKFFFRFNKTKGWFHSKSKTTLNQII